MDVDAAVARGRAAAQALMEDACRVSRPGVRTGTDPTTGRDVVGASTELYAGPCRVQLLRGQEDVRPSGERRWTLQRMTLWLPMAVTGVRVGDVVQVTRTALDADLAGRGYRVVHEFAKTHATSRRLTCEEVTG